MTKCNYGNHNTYIWAVESLYQRHGHTRASLYINDPASQLRYRQFDPVTPITIESKKWNYHPRERQLPRYGITCTQAHNTRVNRVYVSRAVTNIKNLWFITVDQLSEIWYIKKGNKSSYLYPMEESVKNRYKSKTNEKFQIGCELHFSQPHKSPAAWEGLWQFNWNWNGH